MNQISWSSIHLDSSAFIANIHTFCNDDHFITTCVCMYFCFFFAWRSQLGQKQLTIKYMYDTRETRSKIRFDSTMIRSRYNKIVVMYKSFTYTHVCTCAHTYICTHVCMCTCTCIYIYIYICICICICILRLYVHRHYVYTYVHYIYIYIYKM